jgi:hypothetical protein
MSRNSEHFFINFSIVSSSEKKEQITKGADQQAERDSLTRF